MTFYYGDLNDKLSIKKSNNKVSYILNTNHLKSNKVAHLTTVAYVTTPNYINKYKNLLGGNISLVEVPKIRAVDINDIVDFKFAENLINKKMNILVTGAGGTIGSAIVEDLLHNGFNLILCDIKKNEFIKKIEKKYKKQIYFKKADITKFNNLKGF